MQPANAQRSIDVIVYMTSQKAAQRLIDRFRKKFPDIKEPIGQSRNAGVQMSAVTYQKVQPYPLFVGTVAAVELLGTTDISNIVLSGTGLDMRPTELGTILEPRKGTVNAYQLNRIAELAVGKPANSSLQGSTGRSRPVYSSINRR